MKPDGRDKNQKETYSRKQGKIIKKTFYDDEYEGEDEDEEEN